MRQIKQDDLSHWFILDKRYRVLYTTFMRITTQGDYALRCILSIARNYKNGPVAISRIVEDEGLPVDYIEQLLMKLRRKNIIKSIRGARGGYLLNKPPLDITIKDVIEAVEGEAFKIICDRYKKHKLKYCDGVDGCLLKGVWVGLKKEIEGYLDKKTIASLL
ncbi:MAG: Rrf2 family transcriptional regulator [Candidatus Omnitrophica bacterium CG_4_10_14_0_2_um_filter_44_9]|nr:MAG: Rrf2 family transcriptional regulator [Candidatus Omnitrophica bacterium CG_4_10_14_0_8_um_filter_44_12]PIZ84477.1 MAG: Rrf2 family transcriptional regulator [Candidatus Omnitrophica bacterium CG_4_10_14_0_2_um_filter_44_9]